MATRLVLDLRGRAMPRLVVGLAISAAFLVLVLGRVDLGQVGAVLRRADGLLILAALGVVAVDLLVRAVRWRVLLAGLMPNPPGIWRAASYLTIGFMANAILPARLGDLVRAYLAGSAFGAHRLAMLGSVVVERVSDGLAMVGLALASSFLVVGFGAARDLQVQALALAALVAVGLAGLGAAWLLLVRGPLAERRAGRLARDLVGRIGAGAAALRGPRGGVAVLGLTAAAAATASLVSALVVRSLGLDLSPAQVVLFTSGIALSLAIPAAPSSLGTFEFTGVLILTAFGATAEVALAAMLLVRLVTTVPLAITGLLVTWVTHLRPFALVARAAAEAGVAEETA